MTDLEIRPCFDVDNRRKYVADSPINFETWLELSHDIDSELVRGVMIDIMAAQYPHEWIFGWLYSIMSPFATHLKLGVVLGSRSAVKITENDGRLPDILFVRADNTDIIQNNAIYGVPDLVIEIVSENDRPSDLVPLEADYRTIGVPEIIFIDPKKKRVRILHKQNGDYTETILTAGRWEPRSLPGFWIEVEWLFLDFKPDQFRSTRQLMEAADTSP